MDPYNTQPTDLQAFRRTLERIARADKWLLLLVEETLLHEIVMRKEVPVVEDVLPMDVVREYVIGGQQFRVIRGGVVGPRIRENVVAREPEPQQQTVLEQIEAEKAEYQRNLQKRRKGVAP